jgi:hypothetical protein
MKRIIALFCIIFPAFVQSQSVWQDKVAPEVRAALNKGEKPAGRPHRGPHDQGKRSQSPFCI